MEINKFFLEAKKESLKSDYEKHKIGAVAVYKGKVIARGHNSSKSHPIQKKYNLKAKNIKKSNFLHAEMDLVRKLRKMPISYKKVEIYVFRQNSEGQFFIVKPCISCELALRNLGIKSVFYTINNGTKKEVY